MEQLWSMRWLRQAQIRSLLRNNIQVINWITFNSFSSHYFFIKCIEVPLVNNIIEVPSVYFYDTRSVCCMVCPPPKVKVKSSSITIYLTPFTWYYLLTWLLTVGLCFFEHDLCGDQSTLNWFIARLHLEIETYKSRRASTPDPCLLSPWSIITALYTFCQRSMGQNVDHLHLRKNSEATYLS